MERKPAYNNALPKLGLDIGTFAAATWQLQLWAGLVLMNFTFKFKFIFKFTITNQAGRFPNPTNFGNAKRWLLLSNKSYPQKSFKGKYKLNAKVHLQIHGEI